MLQSKIRSINSKNKQIQNFRFYHKRKVTILKYREKYKKKKIKKV